MKTEELQIGDWIRFNDTHRKIAGIFGTPGDFMMLDTYWPSVGYKESTLSFRCEYANPIPLTEDILKKNDFKWLLTESKSITYCINEPTIHVTYYKDSQEWLICVGPSGSIKKRFVEVSCVKYVHELQHALRLCGINKEIVL